MASVAFRKIQIGKEVTRGTAVAADKRLNGTLTVTPMKGRHRPVDERGSLAEYRRSVDISQHAALRWEGDATYQHIIHFLAMALKGGVSPSLVGNATRQQWVFTPNLTSLNAQDSYTFEYGDTDQVWESPFVLAQDLELTVAMNQVVTMRANLLGHFPSKASFTGAISEPSLDEIVANKGKAYIDGTWAGLGGTQKSALVAGATIRIPTGITQTKYLDGALDPSSVSESRRHFEVDLDLILGSDAITEYDAYAADSDRAIRLEFEGATIDDGPFKITFDIFGKYTSNPELLGERDGESMFRLTLASYEDDSGNEFSVTVDNEETSL